MIKIAIHGSQKDLEIIDALAAKFIEQKFSVRKILFLGSKSKIIADHSNFDPLEIGAFVWTQNSNSNDQTELQDRAKEWIKFGFNYLGINIGANLPPANILNANYLSIDDGNLDILNEKIPELIKSIKQFKLRLNFNSSQIFAVLIAHFNKISIELRNIKRTLTLAVLIPSILVVLGIFADLSGLGIIDKTCSTKPFKAMCRSVNIGNLPSLEEEKYWGEIVGKIDCKNFRDYLAKYGANSYYAKNAELRLDSLKKLERRDFEEIKTYESSVRSNLDNSITREAAILSLHENARRASKIQCSNFSKVFNGEFKPAEYKIKSEINCTSDNFCTAEVTYFCYLKIPKETESCGI